MAGTDKGWGKVFVATRLEKQVMGEFMEHFCLLLAAGIRRGDAYSICSGRPAQWSANELVERFLQSECDSILFVDSDAKFEHDTLGKLRDLEEGWEYDILSAFYVRRGWPPEAIWMQRLKDGRYTNMAVLGEFTKPVDAVGLHFCLMRRRVFETIRGPDWFHYPRRTQAYEPRMSEDVAFCEDVIRAGFKIGSTSKVRTGHYSVIPTGWETQNEWLLMNNILQKYGVDPETGEPKDPVAFAEAHGQPAPVANGVNGKHESALPA